MPSRKHDRTRKQKDSLTVQSTERDSRNRFFILRLRARSCYGVSGKIGVARPSSASPRLRSHRATTSYFSARSHRKIVAIPAHPHARTHISMHAHTHTNNVHSNYSHLRFTANPGATTPARRENDPAQTSARCSPAALRRAARRPHVTKTGAHVSAPLPPHVESICVCLCRSWRSGTTHDAT